MTLKQKQETSESTQLVRLGKEKVFTTFVYFFLKQCIWICLQVGREITCAMYAVRREPVSEERKNRVAVSSQPLFDSGIHFLGGAWLQWSWSALGATQGQR